MQILAYAGVCTTLADRYARSSRAKQVGAEFDDLYQEGLISVWQALERGVTPSAEIIEFRMRNWRRYLTPQNPVPYNQLLPLDDYRTSAGG